MASGGAGRIADKGLVIGAAAAGERDKRLTLLCLEQGRITAYAKGAANVKSKFHASAQLFAFSDFTLYDGINFYSLATSDLVEGFFGIQRDLSRICYASFVVELAERVIMPGADCETALRLIYMTLNRLAKTDFPPPLAAAAFELKFLQAEGFCDVSLPEMHLSPECEGLVSAILCGEAREMFTHGASTSNEAVAELAAALDVFRSGILNTPPKSLAVLRGAGL